MDNSLWALSPLDGRYEKKISDLKRMASEAGLIRYRLMAEAEWLIALSECEQIPEVPPFSDSQKRKLREVYLNFKDEYAEKIKEIESETNHDVKAVEYFLKEFAADFLPGKSTDFTHFACTSEDINSVAYALMTKDLVHYVKNMLLDIQSRLESFGEEWKEIPVLSRTHGQPASPSLLGKEILVFRERLRKQTEMLNRVRFSAKMSGAVGNFNAHHAAYPEVNWREFSRRLIEEKLGLHFNNLTTQIEPHDDLAAILDIFSRICTILTDFARDIWLYISLDYFGQKLKKGEVGSSTMPHKVNPIDFENAEGNFLLARSFFRFLSDKLPISRLQRDLTDSTVLRNLGSAFGYLVIALNSLGKGMSKLEVNREVIARDLDAHWEVLAEAVQTVMKRYGIGDAYERLKELTRGEKITREKLRNFISAQNLPEEAKKRLLELAPDKYTGIP